jgi:hypothetical protein
MSHTSTVFSVVPHEHTFYLQFVVFSYDPVPYIFGVRSKTQIAPDVV